MKHSYSFIFLLAFIFSFGLIPGNAFSQLLYDNGPLVNSVGTGSGGADESMLQGTLGMTTIGAGHQLLNLNRVADDFAPVGCGWQIDSIVFFAYQTGSPLTSTMNHVNFRIWNGTPDGSGSTIVYGDTTTNRLSRTVWSGVYRVTNTTSGATTRPLMRNVCNTPGLSLMGGSTYWIDWQTGGTLASGPWVPPITINNMTTTGNSLQRIGGVWAALNDGGTLTQQGLKFLIYGSPVGVQADAGNSVNICPGDSLVLGGSSTAIGGTAPFTYAWSPATGLSSASAANPVATPSATTTYTVVITDSAGCVDSSSITVTLGSLPSQLLGPDTVICPGMSFLLDAGTGASWMWSTGATTQSITATVAGTYSVLVTNGSGCTSADTIIISNPDPVNLGADTVSCPNGTVNITASAGFTGYSWSSGATGQTAALGVGSYTVTAIDNYGCTSTDDITITALPLVSASFNFTAQGNGLGYNFTDNSSNATSWSWSFGDGGTSTVQNPAHTYTADGGYDVTLVACNSCGCDTTSQNITVLQFDEQIGDALATFYPNPAQQEVSVQFGNVKEDYAQVRLITPEGKTIYTYTANLAGGARIFTLPVAELARGVYVLEITAGDRTLMDKIVLR
ncbi:MAG: T9SS type A sorting domain-containing protein [Bacteroidia bacterium]|nr:T9SS type A sorting domain-containing protein [Bacteroidia bacterium]